MSNLSSASFTEPGIARLSQFSLISASGADAVSFLHSQLTNDIKTLAENHACLAGFCTPKGRLLATMLVWKIKDVITMEVPLELQENLQKRLQMYVMRSKVSLQHVSDGQTVFGLFGESALSVLAEWFPDAPSTPYQLVSNDNGTLLRLTDVEGMARYQCVVTKDGQIEPESEWQRSEIHAGIPQVGAATQEKFVPQMINYELIGGVSFKKGCYPGQEIVARTHYLGKQKRRTVLARIPSADVNSGAEVFASTDLEQPCGMVVNAVLNNNGGSDCLIEIKTNFLTEATIQLRSGEICEWLPMPYPLPDDATQTT